MNLVRIPLKMSNVYLVPCKEGYLQVDSGYDRDYPAYRKGLQKVGVKTADIQYLFLTHHHDDHAGFLNQLTRDTSLTILAQRMAKDLLLNGKNDKTHGGGWVSPLIRTLAETKMRFDRNWTLEFPPFALRDRDILLDGDNCDVLRRIGVKGNILYTPGHCIDHQVLLLDSGEVICGDAAANMLLFAGSHYCTVFMTDMEAAYQSWQKMLDAGARVIYPSHGKPFPAARLKEHLGKIKTSQLIPFF
jgi:glyoxylase-like metal-dependent hydrolase (beta-lactamase superfamily II)